MKGPYHIFLLFTAGSSVQLQRKIPNGICRNPATSQSTDLRLSFSAIFLKSAAACQQACPPLDSELRIFPSKGLFSCDPLTSESVRWLQPSFLRSEGQGRRAAEGGEGQDPEGQHPPARVPVATLCRGRRPTVDLGAGGRSGQLPQAVRPLQEQVSHSGGKVKMPARVERGESLGLTWHSASSPKFSCFACCLIEKKPAE